MGEDDLPAPAAPATQLGRQLAASGWTVSVSGAEVNQPYADQDGAGRWEVGAAHVTSTTAVMGAPGYRHVFMDPEMAR